MTLKQDFDARLAEELEADFEGLKEQLRLAMASTVKVKSEDPCTSPKCGCKHIRYVEVPDYKTKLQIAEWWSNRGFGRPGQQVGDVDSERVVFQRLVELPEDA